MLRHVLSLALLSAVVGFATPASATEGLQGSAISPFISNVRQLTFEGRRAGEGYFGPDGRKLIFQSERSPGDPFFQIYVMDLDTGDTHRVSPGVGRATCSWIHPDGKHVMFSSSHLDPHVDAAQKAEYERRNEGRRGKRWDYDKSYDIFVADLDGSHLRNLTDTIGYDAEGSFSPDGSLIAFNSNRQAYDGSLPPADQKRLEEQPEYFCEIYLMNSDGSNVRRLTDRPGDDGGPFFSPDGRRICWRAFSEDGVHAEIWTMNIDGSDKKQITHLGAMSWAPFYHPSNKYLIFATSLHGFDNFELYMVDVNGTKDPVRVTDVEDADVLPVFSPDGRRLAWTSNRTANHQGQLFIGDWNHDAAMERLGLAGSADDRAADATAMLSTSAEINADDLRQHVARLRDCFPPGRQTGRQCLRFVTDYVASVFNSLPIEPAGEDASLFQTCELPLIETRGGPEKAKWVGCNVLARLRSDNPVDDSVVVVGAHVGSLKEGGGAEDHVSGVSGLLEIAQYLALSAQAGDFTPARDVIFAVFVGEELSPGFVAGGMGVGGPPAAARPRFAAYIDLGSVGRLDGPVRLTGVATSPVWRREIERRNVPIGLPIAMEDFVDPNTAAVHFYASGVPVLSLSCGQAADTGERSPELHYDEAARVARLAALITRAVAVQKAPPEFTPIRKPERPRGGPYLGTVPDMTAVGIQGVRLAQVTAGAPAEKAGLKAGDVVVQLGQLPVANLQDYSKALDELRPGQQVPIVVERAGQRFESQITVGARE